MDFKYYIWQLSFFKRFSHLNHHSKAVLKYLLLYLYFLGLYTVLYIIIGLYTVYYIEQ